MQGLQDHIWVADKAELIGSLKKFACDALLTKA